MTHQVLARTTPEGIVKSVVSVQREDRERSREYEQTWPRLEAFAKEQETERSRTPPRAFGALT